MNISNNKPYFNGRELEYIADAIERGCVCGDGYYTEHVTSFIQERFKAKCVLMTTSGTHALEMACMLADLKPGDEVIMPSYTFPSAANAIMRTGAKPVFAEISEDTLNIDPVDAARKVTLRTKAIMPVHYGGISCDMDSINEIAKSNNLYVIEDAAQAVNSEYKGKYLGTVGHFGCYSFHGTKNITSGEGGALLINTDDPEIIRRAGIIRQKGTNREDFLRGDTKRYCWVGPGSSYSPSDILMALLYSQLLEIDRIQNRREYIYNYYSKELKRFADAGIISTMLIPEGCNPNYHLFFLILRNECERDKVMHKLNSRGIGAAIHFVPLHSSPMGINLGYKPDDLKITERAAGCLLRLPMHPGLTQEELDTISAALADILEEL
ncbi:MAG: dTDP-4-amino-4,6-dideoxygalactose transaminase [Clostridiales bacterium]|nr:dTDP-4-amino-4,6-dideoxygalactose transaminase [Clostridiales bacterium]